MIASLPALALGLVTALGLGGCVDPTGKFEAFGQRAGTPDPSLIDGPVGMLYDISGTFLFASDTSIAPGSDPAQHVQFLMTYALTRTGSTATLTTSLQPLRVNPGGVYREPIGAPLVDSNIVVSADGTFGARLLGIIPNHANPVSFNSVQLDGIALSTILSADLVCGPFSGTVAGLDLAGSTFGAIRVTDTTPANLPAPVANCPSNQPVDAGVDAPVPTDAAVPTDAPDPV